MCYFSYVIFSVTKIVRRGEFFASSYDYGMILLSQDAMTQNLIVNNDSTPREHAIISS